jgi:hypothetical protein
VGVSLPSSATFVNAATSIVRCPRILTGANESVMNFRSYRRQKLEFGCDTLRVSGRLCSPYSAALSHQASRIIAARLFNDSFAIHRCLFQLGDLGNQPNRRKGRQA